MPNYITHRVKVIGPTDVMDDFVNLCFSYSEEGKPFFDFSTLIPRPAILSRTVSKSHPTGDELERNIKAQKETGFSNWYDWSVTNWGTKWNCCATEIVKEFKKLDLFEKLAEYTDKADADMEFTFQSAWSVPIPVLHKLAYVFPDLKFDILYFDEGWCFAGNIVIENGVLKDQNMNPDNKLYELVYGHPVESEF